MEKSNRIYSDVDFNFTAHPVTGQLSKVYDAEAIKQSIKNLILTNFYERPFQPSLGGNILGQLFENYDSFTENNLKTSIKDTIIQHEPRARLGDITIKSDDANNGLFVSIEFTIKNVSDPIVLDLILERTR